MKIENIELLELFVDTICSTTAGSPVSEYLPIAEQTSTLAQQLDGKKSIIENMASRIENNGESGLASTMRLLESALNNDVLSTAAKSESHRRLMPYVYPTV